MTLIGLHFNRKFDVVITHRPENQTKQTKYQTNKLKYAIVK